MDPVSRKVPYRHLNEVEVEMAAVGPSSGEVDADIEGRGLDGTQASPPRGNYAPDRPVGVSGVVTLVLACMVAAGVQFGWALQLSLLTPYIQTLGIEHAFSSFIWLCGPITGLVVQPCVGVWSDRCKSKYGKRRPFIFVGALMISVAVTIIGFSADMGYLLGDTDEHCSTYRGPRWRAAAIFVTGFWMLDLANNTVQGPARALLADLSGPSQSNLANAIFCSWMAFGNILGFSSGASGQWHRWFPFLTTRACCESCGNLKAAFLVAVVFLMFCTSVTLYFVKEVPLAVKQASRLSDSAPLLTGSQPMSHDRLNSNSQKPEYSKEKGEVNGKNTFNHLPDHDSDANGQIEAFKSGPSAVIVNILTGLRHLPPGMNAVLIVMALTWLAWFPFFLFDTDWMGREVYNGNPNGTMAEIDSYHEGVREGAFGLLLNSVVLLFSSFLIEPLCKRVGARVVWGISNFIIFACMIATAIISFLSKDNRGSSEIKIASLILFSLLGFPLSITYSVPFSMTAELTAGTGGGQGLATGVLNLSIVVPQMIVSLGAGPWDALFGGGNIPAFFLASIFSLVGGVVALYKLPKLSFKSSGFHGFG